MYCRECRTEMQPGAEICLGCGCRPLKGDRFCQSCGAETAPRQELCTSCGGALEKFSADEYAGFWLRLAAYALDGLIIFFALNLLQTVVAMLFVFTIPIIIVASELFGEVVFNLLMVFILVVFPVLLCVAYFSIMHATPWQASLGKKALGIKVVDARGNRLSISKSFGRAFAMILSFLTLFIGFFMAGFTQRKQALHDMMADTYVIRERRR